MAGCTTVPKEPQAESNQSLSNPIETSFAEINQVKKIQVKNIQAQNTQLQNTQMS